MISTSRQFGIALTALLLGPAVIPGEGLDYQYFFVMALVLLAWFTIKWGAVESLQVRSSHAEKVIGISIVAADYVLNVLKGSNAGIIDFTIVLLGCVVTFYGVRSLKLFWLPAAYGLVLLLGYQLEANTPNFVALQNWLASLMSSTMSILGIPSEAAGHIVTMQEPGGSLSLDVASSCTGVQGILSFGLLSTMALLDTKPKAARLVPILAIGFTGAFLTNIARLLVIFLTFRYFGVVNGEVVHVYFGYLVFVVWVLAFWAIAFRFVGVRPQGNGVLGTSQPVGKPSLR